MPGTLPYAPRGSVLLVFPPLTHLVTHPELGLPQLTATLRAAGWPVRQLDLNTELVFGELRRPERLDELLASLGEDETRFVTSLIPYLEKREAALRAALRRQVTRPPDSRDATSQIRRYLDHAEVVLSRPFAHHLRLGRPRFADAAERRGVVAALLAERRFPWIVAAKLVELFQRTFVQPTSYDPASVRTAVERDDPLLDPFLARRLAESLTEDVRMLGISVHSSLQLVPSLRLAAMARHKARGPLHIVLGGAWCAAARDLLAEKRSLPFDYVDSIAPYESDTTLPALAAALEADEPPDSVPGLLFRRNDATIATPAAPLPPLDTLPRPSFDGLPFALYPEHKIPFRTIRGCYWGRCRFCYHVFEERQQGAGCTSCTTEMSPALLERLVRTVRQAQEELGAGELTLADNATPPRHLDEIAGALRKAGIAIRWQALVRFDREFTPALCRRIAEAGCRELSFGLETSSPEEWKRLRKGIDRGLVLRCLDACRDAGIETTVFLLDYPSQKPEDYERSLAFVCEHHPRISRFIPLRFELGRNAPAFDDPAPFGITLNDDSKTSLAVYDLPFEAAQWMPQARFRELTERYSLLHMRLQSDARKRRPKRRRAGTRGKG